MTYTDSKGKSISISTIVHDASDGGYLFIGCDCDALLYGDGELVAYSQGGSYDEECNCIRVSAGSMVYAIYKVE